MKKVLHYCTILLLHALDLNFLSDFVSMLPVVQYGFLNLNGFVTGVIFNL